MLIDLQVKKSRFHHIANSQPLVRYSPQYRPSHVSRIPEEIFDLTPPLSPSQLTPSIENSLNSSSNQSPQKSYIKDSLLSPNRLSEYDPYKIPADLKLAENHGKARLIGKMKETPLNTADLCPCCSMPIEKERINLGCNLQEIAFLGSAYPFYFDFLKKIIAILGVILLVSGTLKLTLINYNCNESCVTFFGFGVLNLNDYKEQLFGQSGLDTIFSIFLIIFMLFIKSQCFEAIKLYNDNALSPSFYTLMVQNLPRNTTRKEIYEYFKELIQKDIIKVNMAFDISRFKALFKRKLKISSEIKGFYDNLQEGLDHQDPYIMKRIDDLESENSKIEDQLAQYQSMCEESNPENFTGTAFITFKSQASVRILIDQWGVSFLRNLEFVFFGKWSNPYLKFGNNTVLVHEAPDPTDLIWENLSFSICRDIFNYTFLYLLSGLILVLSFYIQFQVVLISMKMKEELEEKMEMRAERNLIVKTAALGISSITIMINFLLRLTVFFFAYFEKPYSNSKFNQSYINIYILLAFFNSALMPYLVNTFIYSSNTSEQLIWDIHFILLCNAFSTPIFKCFDPILWLRKLMVTYIRYKGKKCLMPQHNVNYWFENTSMDIAENYAYITRTLLLAVWYSSVAPLGLIYCMMGLAVNYWLDKFLLLRVNSFPQHQNEQIIYKFINNLEIIPYLYMYGAIEYHSRIVVSENLIEWIWSFLFYGISSISLTLCLVIYIACFKHKVPSKNLSPLSYEEVRYLFVSEYDRTNPITQDQANKEFFISIKNNRCLSPVQKRKLIRKTAALIDPNIVNGVIGRRGSYWPPESDEIKHKLQRKDIEMMCLSAKFRRNDNF